jgi:Fe-S-cluster containining protein
VTLSPADVFRVRAAGAVTVTLRQGGASGAGELVEKLGTRRDSSGRFVCAQLDGEPGGACGCRIYESRPEACRRLEPGSVACVDARRRWSLA